MKVMMLVKANKDSEAGVMPSEALLGAMASFHEELVKAGVLLDLAGLTPTSMGKRVVFSGSLLRHCAISKVFRASRLLPGLESP